MSWERSLGSLGASFVGRKPYPPPPSPSNVVDRLLLLNVLRSRVIERVILSGVEERCEGRRDKLWPWWGCSRARQRAEVNGDGGILFHVACVFEGIPLDVNARRLCGISMGVVDVLFRVKTPAGFFSRCALRGRGDLLTQAEVFHAMTKGGNTVEA